MEGILRFLFGESAGQFLQAISAIIALVIVGYSIVATLKNNRKDQADSEAAIVATEDKEGVDAHLLVALRSAVRAELAQERRNSFFPNLVLNVALSVAFFSAGVLVTLLTTQPH